MQIQTQCRFLHNWLMGLMVWKGLLIEDIKNHKFGAYFVVRNRESDPGFCVVSNRVTNNGGLVVGVADNTYYWKMTSQSIKDMYKKVCSH